MHVNIKRTGPVNELSVELRNVLKAVWVAAFGAGGFYLDLFFYVI